MLQQFKSRILSFIPTAEIESVRFRSVPFQKLITKLSPEGDPTPGTKEKELLRQHDTGSHVRPGEGTAKRPENALPLMDPYEATKLAVEKRDGTIFQGKTIKVDSVRKGVAGDAGGEGGSGDPFKLDFRLEP